MVMSNMVCKEAQSAEFRFHGDRVIAIAPGGSSGRQRMEVALRARASKVHGEEEGDETDGGRGAYCWPT